MKIWDIWWENWNFLLRFRKKEFRSLKCFTCGVIVHKLSSLTNFHNKNLISDYCAESLLMIRAHYRILDKINSHIVSSVYLNWNLKVDLKIWGDIVKQCMVVGVQRDVLLASCPMSRSFVSWYLRNFFWILYFSCVSLQVLSCLMNYINILCPLFQN